MPNIKFNRRLTRVRNAFNPHDLSDIAMRGELDFKDLGTFVDLPRRGDHYYYQDNGSDILAVAHLDSVYPARSCSIVDTDQGWLVTTSSLDDRLGVYVICRLLPALGIKVDWLLTTGEESGSSTAGDFDTDKKYRWMFQFDRTGTDVVTYEYGDADLHDRLRRVGYQVGEGSFSDICWLNHLGIQGFNVGVGYQNYHSKRAFAWLEDTFAQVARFTAFYDLYKDQSMPWVDDGYNRFNVTSWGDWSRWQPSRADDRDAVYSAWSDLVDHGLTDQEIWELANLAEDDHDAYVEYVQARNLPLTGRRLA